VNRQAGGRSAPRGRGGPHAALLTFTAAGRDLRAGAGGDPFPREQDAIRIANKTPYGLAAGVWSSDLGRSLRVARKIQSG